MTQAITVGGKTVRSSNGQHTVEIDFAALPEASQAFVVTYGLKQYLADGAAGAENHDQLVEGVNARVEKLLSGDLSRARGEGKVAVDSETGRALKLAKDAIRLKAKAAKVTLPKEKVAAMAETLVEKDGSYRKEAKRQLAAEATMRDAGGEEDFFAAMLSEAGVIDGPVEADTDTGQM